MPTPSSREIRKARRSSWERKADPAVVTATGRDLFDTRTIDLEAFLRSQERAASADTRTHQ